MINDLHIRIDHETKKFLDSKKLIPRESYKSVIKRLLRLTNGKSK